MFAVEQTKKTGSVHPGSVLKKTGTPAFGKSQPLQRAVGNSLLQSSATGKHIQRKCACGGSCSACGVKDETKRIQTKLRVGLAHDAYEQEADRVADSIMRMPETSIKKETQSLASSIQRIADGDGGGFDPGPDFQAQQNGGQPLSASTRNFMEPRFGTDFSQVRVHTDSGAQASANQIQARAYTFGNHITLGNDASENDKHLMAHELTHVVQQGGAEESAQRTPLSPRIQRDPPPAADPCPDGVKTITVDLVSLRGSNRDPNHDLTFANTVFRSCCVQFQLGTGLTVHPDDSDRWLGGDTVLDRLTACGTISTEEQTMYDEAAANYGITSPFRAFYVASMNPGARGASKPPYCATGVAAPYVNTARISNTAQDRSLAHEFGHILLNSGAHTGIDNPADTANLMIPTNNATGSTLDATQCATIFGNA